MAKLKRRIANESNIPQCANAHENEPVTIELSPAAKTNLEKLRLRSLDKQGRQPEPSQVIERLINSAAVSEPDAPYPG